MKVSRIYILVITISLASCFQNKKYEAQVEEGKKGVYIIKYENRYALIRNGRPYQIKGACGIDQLEILMNIGGNSVRTYDTKRLDKILEECHKNSLTISVGLFLDHIDILQDCIYSLKNDALMTS